MLCALYVLPKIQYITLCIADFCETLFGFSVCRCKWSAMERTLDRRVDKDEEVGADCEL